LVVVEFIPTIVGAVTTVKLVGLAQAATVKAVDKVMLGCEPGTETYWDVPLNVKEYGSVKVIAEGTEVDHVGELIKLPL
jgi:hypothetical protein